MELSLRRLRPGGAQPPVALSGRPLRGTLLRDPSGGVYRTGPPEGLPSASPRALRGLSEGPAGGLLRGERVLASLVVSVGSVEDPLLVQQLSINRPTGSGEREVLWHVSSS